MTVQELQQRNERFQQRATKMVDFLPGGSMLDSITSMVRSMRLIDKYFVRLLQVKEEILFNQIMGLIEEEMDEAVYNLDSIENRNKKAQMKALSELLKEGYDLLSLYSMCCDLVISKRVKEDEEWQ
jgi:hypothetical protein